MQLYSANSSLSETALLTSNVLDTDYSTLDSLKTVAASESTVVAIGGYPIEYRSRFTDCMEMNAESRVVADYLDAHQGWFRRCAQPMRVDPLGDNGYALGIGRFGALGYELEPKLGLNLLPQNQGIYRITTIPIPGYTIQGYSVDFQATMNLVEVPTSDPSISDRTTRVEWELDLTVTVQFPRFIQRLSKSLVQTTGDRLLRQIVRQISRRLTYKVQEDFHFTLGLPMPQSAKKS
jgi:hypothetical protein